jgi:hypothetical protein
LKKFIKFVVVDDSTYVNFNNNNNNNNNSVGLNAFLLLLVRFNILPIHPVAHKMAWLSIRCKKTDQ